MEKILNLVFYKDIRKHLYQEKLSFLVVIKDDKYYVRELEPNFNCYKTCLNDYLCYDYDTLSLYNRLITENNVVNLINVKENIYIKKK